VRCLLHLRNENLETHPHPFQSKGHQYLLSTSLQTWTLSSDRNQDSIISQNKEGIVSFPGYLSIFVIGFSIGITTFPPDPYFFYRKLNKKSLVSKQGKLASVLASHSILWSGTVLALRLAGFEVSRRLVRSFSFV
jgi:glucosaminylphosphatidylinositol acyltransferase